MPTSFLMSTVSKHNSDIWGKIYKTVARRLAIIGSLSSQGASNPIYEREFAKATIALQNMCQKAYSLSRMFGKDSPNEEEICKAEACFMRNWNDAYTALGALDAYRP